jgi:ABC-type amino acid transport substrate-binding protein
MVTALLFLAANSAIAQQPAINEALAGEVTIGTKEAPPFAMKEEDGSWTGISIELWQNIAAKLGIRSHFAEEATVRGLLDGVATGKYDFSVAAITITPERERLVDFTHAFYETGLGIAVPTNAGSVMREITRTMTSFGFIQAVLALMGIALAVGALVWIFEHRHNEEFGGGAVKGLGTSIWWSAEAMTQASTGTLGPKTLPGRILAIIWMVTSIIAIAVFTASVTSALTTREMRGLVHGVDDLPSVRVGAVAGSATINYLNSQRIRYRPFATPLEGLRALEEGTIDAFVYDRPLLAYMATRQFSASVEVLDVTFDRQSYGIAMPTGSRLRKKIDVALLEEIQSDWWKQALFRYLGQKQ